MKLNLSSDLYYLKEKILGTVFDDKKQKADVVFMVSKDELKKKFECFGCCYEAILDATFVVSKIGFTLII